MKTTQQFLNFYVSAGLDTDGVIGQKSQSAIKKALIKLEDTYKSKGWEWNNKFNILAIRVDQTFTDITSDWFIIVENNTLLAVPCSTKAGKYYVYNPISYGGITGTAVLKEGQYKQTWQFVTAKNWQTLWLQTPYLNQIKPVTIFRDGNKDLKVDKNITQTGLFGINIHTAGWNNLVWNWSAGCIVIPRQHWVNDVLPKFKAFKIYDFTLLEV